MVVGVDQQNSCSGTSAEKIKCGGQTCETRSDNDNVEMAVILRNRKFAFLSVASRGQRYGVGFEAQPSIS